MYSVQAMDDLQVRAAATDILSYLVEFSPSMVREFVMQEPQQADDVSVSSTYHTSFSWSHLNYFHLFLALALVFAGFCVRVGCPNTFQPVKTQFKSEGGQV